MPPAEAQDTGAPAPAVSVVIPVYNKAAYIARTLDSVAAQTFRDFEVVVVDDGSSDESADIVAAYPDPRIRLIRQENGGQSVATNNAIRAAKGDLIALLDGDDEWLPEHLEDLVQLRTAYPDAGILATGFRRVYEPGLFADITLDPAKVERQHGQIDDCFSSGVYGIVFWTGAIGIPKPTFERVGYFLEGEVRAQDIEMWARIILAMPAAFHRRVSAIYRWDADGRGMNAGLEWYPPMAKKIDGLTAQGGCTPAARQHLIDYKHAQLNSYVAHCASSGNRQEALRTLTQDMEQTGVHARRILISRLALTLLPLRLFSLFNRLSGSRWMNFGPRIHHGALVHTYVAPPEPVAVALARTILSPLAR